MLGGLAFAFVYAFASASVVLATWHGMEVDLGGGDHSLG